MTKETRKEDLANAREMLRGWIKAEQAVMLGQEYRIGTRSLKRADLGMIASRIKFWQDEEARLEGSSHIRIRQIVPRDI
jgi:hypothetical protein